MNKVLLPMEHRAREGEVPMYFKMEVIEALDRAGVAWAEESPEQARIRQLEAQVESLKQALAKAVPAPVPPAYKPTIPSRREP